MKYVKNIIFMISMIILAGCTPMNTENNITPDSDVSSVQYDTQVTQELQGTSEAHNDELVTISKETDTYSIVLSYTVYDEADEKLEISPSTLVVMNKSTGEKHMPDGNLYLGVSQSDDRYVIDEQPYLDIIEFSDWYLAAVRVPCHNGKETVHTVFLYYFNDSTVQILGYHMFYPVISADSKIEADIENNCFSLTDTEGNIERYTVVYDQYETIMPYCLRSADYSTEPIMFTQNTKQGEVSFSYNIYERTDTSLTISKHNFVEINNNLGEKFTCEVRNPVYQGGSSYDGLTEIDAPIEFEVIELSGWGVAAVRVPYTSSGKQMHSVTLYYFDNKTLQLLGDGYFIPDTFVDSEITADIENNCFSVTNMDGITEWYTVTADTNDPRHILLQPVL